MRGNDKGVCSAAFQGSGRCRVKCEYEYEERKSQGRYILAGETDGSLLGMMRHKESRLALWRYVMAAMHSASMDGASNTGPQTCSSSMAAGV